MKTSTIFWIGLAGAAALAFFSLDGNVHASEVPARRRRRRRDDPDDAPPPTPPTPPRRIPTSPSTRKVDGREQNPLYVTDEVEALGRVIHSELGSGTHKQKLHIAWATRNLARERKQTIAKMACTPCGKQRGRKPPVSTRHPARRSDMVIAAEVLATPQSQDPTGGATHFLDPGLQDRLAARGRPGYAGNTYAKVRHRWINKFHWEPYYRLGKDLELWGPQRTSKTS